MGFNRQKNSVHALFLTISISLNTLFEHMDTVYELHLSHPIVYDIFQLWLPL